MGKVYHLVLSIFGDQDEQVLSWFCVFGGFFGLASDVKISPSL